MPNIFTFGKANEFVMLSLPRFSRFPKCTWGRTPCALLTEQQYDKEMMFPVFDGLIPEGWLLDIASSAWKIDPRDRMSLLMACCKDCIGNISVKPLDYV